MTKTKAKAEQDEAAAEAFSGARIGHLRPQLLGGELVATHAKAPHHLALFRGGGQLVLLDLNAAANGAFLDVVVGGSLAELRRKLEDRAGDDPSHPSPCLDPEDEALLAKAAEVLGA